MTDRASDGKDTASGKAKRPRPNRRAWAVGISIGVILSAVVVLSSGFMVEVTNTDTFCIECHAMTPFRTSWQNSVHGGKNPQGFTAQCVDCHLPHGNFVEYLTAKAVTGTGDIIANIGFKPAEFDWAANAEESRTHFTYDSACHRCHAELIPPGLTPGGMSAHREYMNGATEKKCVSCHPHVGHKDMLEEAQRCFSE